MNEEKLNTSVIMEVGDWRKVALLEKAQSALKILRSPGMTIFALATVYNSGFRFPELGKLFDAILVLAPLTKAEWRAVVDAEGGDRCPICGDKIEYRGGVHCAAMACPSQNLA